jgi:hypothetical protein
VWAGVDNAWEQKKLEARKMFLEAADSHTSGARFVGQFFILHETMFLTTQFLIRCRTFQELLSSRQNSIDYEDRQTLKRPKA